jgi:hypothetical protein
MTHGDYRPTVQSIDESGEVVSEVSGAKTLIGDT